MKGVWVVWPAWKYREMYLPAEDLPQNMTVVPDLIVKRLHNLICHLPGA